MELKEVIKEFAKKLVDNPDEVQVREVRGDFVTVLEVQVADGEAGKVIGKGGNIANAFRTLIGGVAAKERRQIVFQIGG